MTDVRATYRLQFRNGFGFAEASAVIPHLAAAGISHVYASPIFRAAKGSTHGYDVADHNEIAPSLGGMAGFEAFSATLKAHGLGLILDIVPNHMAAHSDNPWWRDVLKYGEASRFARHFDIDWAAGKLVLPILGKPYGHALAEGDISRATHPEFGEVLRVPGQDLPLAPGTETIGDVHACHEAQPYRLTYWRLGRDGLTYRRFFEITGLVGVRVDDRAVFDDVHRLIGRLIADGHVAGLRVDHVDGLADPAGYLERLSAFGVPVWVEKILEHGEVLPDWPLEGTTGYEFIAALGAAFVDGDGLDALSTGYRHVANDDVVALERAAKHQIATVNLAGEFLRLTVMAQDLFAGDLAARDHGADTVRRGLVALSCALPVYRTYAAPRPSETDRTYLEAARATSRAPELDELSVVDDLAALIASGRQDAAPFVARWQQTTGPLMAKAVEDTLFYRHHRLIALNEVGSHPGQAADGDALGAALCARGMVTTQTHDTKRGEDARARLYQLSHPDALAWWNGFWPTVGEGLAPRWQWALAQMWVGSVPLAPDPAFYERFCDAVMKSAREAKQETSWTDEDSAFEGRLLSGAEALGGRTPDAGAERILRAGAVAGLAQALLRMFASAVPDTYQGGFGWDFSMVDPDNRRPVDFAAEAALCDTAMSADAQSLTTGWQDGRIKARVLMEGLWLRRTLPAIFRSNARIQRLTPPDSPVAAFLRSSNDGIALAAVPLRPFGALSASGASLDPARLGSVTVDLPTPVTTRFIPETLGSGPVELTELLARFPVVLATG